MIDLAMKHFKASMFEDSQEDPELPGKDEAVLDCNMLISETEKKVLLIEIYLSRKRLAQSNGSVCSSSERKWQTCPSQS